MTTGGRTRVTTLWRLVWRDDQVACVVYRSDSGLQLVLESSAATILTEPLEMQPRALARTQALREALKRRGWQDAPTGAI